MYCTCPGLCHALSVCVARVLICVMHRVFVLYVSRYVSCIGCLCCTFPDLCRALSVLANVQANCRDWRGTLISPVCCFRLPCYTLLYRDTNVYPLSLPPADWPEQAHTLTFAVGRVGLYSDVCCELCPVLRPLTLFFFIVTLSRLSVLSSAQSVKSVCLLHSRFKCVFFAEQSV